LYIALVWLLIVLGLAAPIIGVGGAFLSSSAQRHATRRCTATPPGFPRTLRGAEISVDWKVFPFSYECVYVTRNSVVRRPPP
jgi:hypothetical protein